MCGIFGAIGHQEPIPILRRMAKTLQHRGPDDAGFFHDRSVALGHTRLSIIDLSGGHQPMVSVDQQLVLVFNGEIYNFKDVRAELEALGHSFLTSSDTEVILQAYRAWGTSCLNKFNGMFAFALWDNRIQRLWLVRDRLGKKPLYMLHQAGVFYFASEAKALWSLPGLDLTYDPRAIDHYLNFRYVPGERTFHQEIKKLPPGQWLMVDHTGCEVARHTWWQVPAIRGSATSLNRSIHSYHEEFSALLSSAVKLRMIADVPIGAFLSSGIDSVSIAAEMAKTSRPTFFTIGFGGKNDELDAAAKIARELGGTHHTLCLQAKDFDIFPDVVASMDEPYGDPIILPTYLLAKEAARHVKVVLTGDGADEILGGYIHHVFFRQMPATLPPWMRHTLAAMVRKLPVQWLDTAFHYPAGMGTAGRSRLADLFESYADPLASYMNFASLFDAKARRNIYTPEWQRALANTPDEVQEEMDAHFSNQGTGLFDKVLQWDIRTWFPEQTLMKLDRLTMAHSIEGRCPYADHRLAEFFFKMPFDAYRILCQNKNVVRRIHQSSRGYLPRKKKPFYLPMHEGFDKKLIEFQNEVLDHGAISRMGWFDAHAIGLLQKNRAASPLLIDKQIMNITVLLYWLKMKEQKGNV